VAFILLIFLFNEKLY